MCSSGFGKMAERLKALAWKASVPKGTTGSNPVFTAKYAKVATVAF